MYQPMRGIDYNMSIQNDEGLIRINVSVERFEKRRLVIVNIASAKMVLRRQLFLRLCE